MQFHKFHPLQVQLSGAGQLGRAGGWRWVGEGPGSAEGRDKENPSGGDAEKERLRREPLLEAAGGRRHAEEK